MTFKLDVDNVLFWMDAIRNSNDTKRTLDAFYKGQIKSKIWLIDKLSRYVNGNKSFEIHGGWVGTLASLLFQSHIDVRDIVSIDIDPSCEKIAYDINKLEEMQGRFKAVTMDMVDFKSEKDIAINTSCEHITQEQYDLWLSNRKNDLIVLQSNNYNIDEHVRTVNNIDEFINQSNLEVLWAGSLVLPLYTRFMIIGNKNV